MGKKGGKERKGKGRGKSKKRPMRGFISSTSKYSTGTNPRAIWKGGNGPEREKGKKKKRGGRLAMSSNHGPLLRSSRVLEFQLGSEGG